MGFEDDFDLQDNFETETPDPDGEAFGEKSKRLSRKEMREAKKKNAERAADLPKTKKSLFNRHQRLDDSDAGLSDEHIFDPARSPMISTGLEREHSHTNEPIRSQDSEFSYLFDPSDGSESEDDVYPEQSIYSDSERARDLLAGLSYDEKKDGDDDRFDHYFEETQVPSSSSRFSFRRHGKKEDESSEEKGGSAPSASPAVRVTVKKSDAATDADGKADAFLPELRPDSVFRSDAAAPSVSAAAPASDRSEGLTAGSGTGSRRYDEPESEEDYMGHDMDKPVQEFIPYGGMYPSYPMAPANQMIPYPLVIPSGGQNQGGSMPYQTIPIPYPMPMPMPMPMYSQAPQYPAYPQYQQPYPPAYPPYPQGYPPYPPYDDRRYDRRYDDSRYDRRDDRRYDDSRYDRRDDRRYDDSRYDRQDDRRYDDRRYDRQDDRRYDGDDRRYDRQDDSRYDRRETERSRVPAAPYEPPVPAATSAPEPILSVTPEPTPVSPLTAAAPEPSGTPSVSALDFSFHKPVETPPAPAVSPDPPASAAPTFDGDLFTGMKSDSMVTGIDESDDFGLGFGGRGISVAASPAGGSDPAEEEEGKPKGGRFKKRH